MMKKWLAWTLCAWMLVSGAAGLADATIEIADGPTEVALGQDEAAAGPGEVTVLGAQSAVDTIGIQEGTQLNVGMTTAPAGYFAMTLFGNNAADLSVRALLHGYSTVAFTHDAAAAGLATMGEDGSGGAMIFDGTALASVRLEGNGVDERKYVFTLAEGLTYNDGTPITAKDYVFSLLLSASPLIAELGGAPRDISQFVGHAAYLSGERVGLAGVRLISELEFSLEVDPAFLPYFYGIAMMEITPYPMGVIAPDCDIVDEGEGCSIQGAFTKELLAKTLLDPVDGYLMNPRVTSGPYQLESYDAETGVVTMKVNPEYKGNYEGAKPHVETLTLRRVENDQVMALLQSGEINLVSELVSGNVVTAGLELRMADPTKLQVQSYPRNGLAYLALACEKGVTADVAVRQAIAQCVDKAAIISAVSPYSLQVDAYYGLGQWMPNYIAEDAGAGNEEAAETGLNMPQALAALNIPFDVEAAKATLSDAGWNLSAKGGDYQSGVRYRKGDEGLEPLRIRWAKTANTTADRIRAVIEPAMTEAGFKLIVEDMPFGEVLQYFYRQKSRADYDMCFMASDFLEVFDPYYDYHTDEAYQGVMNTSGLRDAELMALAEAMRSTPATEQGLYAERWLAFQRAWVEKLPLVPLYSNVYYDFFDADIRDYDNVRSLNWGYAMPYVWVGEALVALEASASEGLALDGEPLEDEEDGLAPGPAEGTIILN